MVVRNKLTIFDYQINSLKQSEIMAKRPRFFNPSIPQPIKEDTPLRRLFERYNGCAQSVRLELQRMETKGQSMSY